MKHIIMFPMNDETLQNKLFEGIKRHNLNNDDLTFLHVFEEIKYPYIIPPYIYPSDKEKPGVKETVENVMQNMAKGFLGDKAVQWNFLCLFDENPKEGAFNYVKEGDYTSVVCATKEKSGVENLFHSSFTEYLVKHSPTDVIVMR